MSCAPFPSCNPSGGFMHERRYALILQHHQPEGCLRDMRPLFC